MNKIETGIYTRVSKRIAKKMYNNGKSVYIVPCKVYPSDDNYWIKPFDIRYPIEQYYKDINNHDLSANKFDNRITSFEYYNCNHALGYYTAFYIKVKD